MSCLISQQHILLPCECKILCLYRQIVLVTTLAMGLEKDLSNMNIVLRQEIVKRKNLNPDLVKSTLSMWGNNGLVTKERHIFTTCHHLVTLVVYGSYVPIFLQQKAIHVLFLIKISSVLFIFQCSYMINKWFQPLVQPWLWLLPFEGVYNTYTPFACHLLAITQYESRKYYKNSCSSG